MFSHIYFHLSATEVFRRWQKLQFDKSEKAWVGWVSVKSREGSSLHTTALFLFCRFEFNLFKEDEKHALLLARKRHSVCDLNTRLEPKMGTFFIFYLTSRLLNHIIVKRDTPKTRKKFVKHVLLLRQPKAPKRINKIKRICIQLRI